ncbi:MAG: helix-turn-helix transcriptional regulator [bacterium]|nr:helix-turn-helix transcriptional regulator [bacterium]
MLDNEFFKEFGFNLKMYRMKLGYTQAELGEMVEISEHRISDIENGKCNITLKSVNKLSNALKISPSKLFNFDN